MDLSPADIPLIRLKWLNARASRRRADAEEDAVLAKGVMLMLAKLRFQIYRAALIAEAEALQKRVPASHDMRNDCTAVIFLCKLHAKGIAVDLRKAHECLERLRAEAP